jgi:hypothetical protein
MPSTLDPEIRRALVERVRYYYELGIYDFYKRDSSRRNAPVTESQSAALEAADPNAIQPELREGMSPRKSAAIAVVEENTFEALASKPEYAAADPLQTVEAGSQADCLRRRQPAR